MAIGIRILDDINKFNYIVKKLRGEGSIVFLMKKDYVDINKMVCNEFNKVFILKSEHLIDNIISMLSNTISDDINIISISVFTLFINNSPFISLNKVTAFFAMVEFRNKNCTSTNIDQAVFYSLMESYEKKEISIEEFAEVFE